MKKTALIATVFIVLFFVFGIPVRAQTLTFDRAYQDYQYNLTIYQQAYSDYVNAKNAYLQGGETLALKDDATKKTFIMLQDRDQLMVVYLTALRSDISEQSGLSQDDKNAIFGKIDPEVIFYTNHKTQYSQSDDLSTLFNKSGQSQSQYKNTTSLIVTEALFDISLGQLATLRIAHEQIYGVLKNIIDSGVSAGTLKIDPFSRWLDEIATTDQMLIQNEGTAKGQIGQIYSQIYAAQGGYDAALTTLNSSINLLSQYNQYLTQVLDFIKTNQ